MTWLLIGVLVLWAVVVAWAIADAYRTEKAERLRTNQGRNLARKRDLP